MSYLPKILCGSACSILIFAQTSEKGAKAIFFDTQTGAMAIPSVTRTFHRASNVGPTKAVERVPAITGLMYYLELLQPDGQLIRVTSTHAFHSGDKVRLHVTSNVNGSLLILQSQDGNAFQELFPSSKVAKGTDKIVKATDTVLPGPNAWFQFDEHPGDIQLLILLRAQAVPDAEGRSTVAGNTSRAVSVNTQAYAIKDLEQKQEGSKGLQIETDASPQQPSEFRVVDSRADPSLPAGEIVVQVKLTHRA